ncbi:hypothetical protein [Senegalia sp. (in: firmicutes)]|uniref:hypothetical protein n=1 Tax=Senegalia sp. (in: firmicutes) TaxID=1924098 RepID=UPI003F9B1190
MKIAKIIFAIVVIVSLVVVVSSQAPEVISGELLLLVGLLLFLSIVDGRVFTRQREKDRNILVFLIKFVGLIGLFYLLF